jgi:hypothetical protein
MERLFFAPRTTLTGGKVMPVRCLLFTVPDSREYPRPFFFLFEPAGLLSPAGIPRPAPRVNFGGKNCLIREGYGRSYDLSERASRPGSVPDTEVTDRT